MSRNTRHRSLSAGKDFFVPVTGRHNGVHLANEIDRVLLTQDDIRRAMTRISHEILEQNRASSDLVLVGLQTRGVHLARRLAENIERIEGFKPVVGTLDPRLWRDDPDVASSHPLLPSDIPNGVDGKPVVIVDDVLYTGRTIRAAMEALLDFGRASRIQLAVLVDRGHRELPIRPDFIGKNVPTARGERVQVRITEIDGDDAVVLGRES
ncbi:MAG: bifunctional pyr operon transcriptional regulator/uracil phosphoribosyltransferase PyrR [Chloroflexi bacterium]|nr:bifunctional pyr operon transcriptional regulator/uracil phosphoribosyltransferase PyrR [Chloroflexota bacterium]